MTWGITSGICSTDKVSATSVDCESGCVISGLWSLWVIAGGVDDLGSISEWIMSSHRVLVITSGCITIIIEGVIFVIEAAWISDVWVTCWLVSTADTIAAGHSDAVDTVSTGA